MEYGVLTVSDRCYRGEYEDFSGPMVPCMLSGIFVESTPHQTVVPDEIEAIQSVVLDWCQQDFALVLTTGGTGFAPRDVTPEAVAPLIERRADALAQAMISAGLEKTPFAALSRPVCGIRDRTIIITLPGSPKAVEEILTAVGPVLLHAVKLLRGEPTSHIPAENGSEEPVNNDPEAISVDPEPAATSNQGSLVGRPRESPFRMLELEEAKAVVGSVLMQRLRKKSDVQMVIPQNALGRFCAETLYASAPFPPFRTSTRDGYAVRSDGSLSPSVREYAATAGASVVKASTVNTEWCVRISTGGVLPAGADAVVQVEDTEVIEADTVSDTELRIQIRKRPSPAENVREIGSDFQEGSVLVKMGDQINAGTVGLLVMAGISFVPVVAPPVVGVLSTGNELSSDHDQNVGSVPDSNRPMLLSLLKSFGIEGIDLGVVTDSEGRVLRKLKEATKCDILITSGGVSMGEKDIIKGMLMRSGYDIHFGRVNLKPGKPTTLASKEGQVVFALPGNPASAFVMFHIFVLHALHFLGCALPLRTLEAVIDVPEPLILDRRPELMRAKLYPENATLRVCPLLNQQSSSLFHYHTVNALISLPSRDEVQRPVKSGDLVSVYCLNF
ncbi:gephyrin [Galendromus occidentalis]|uniref:Gephyrin n=1 Tax=Galendromus occidentalis TaxID=34638 RepID=A0AAJ6QYA1_9ACAR|nr:gephyrin [Galendromus occidentalis]